MFCFETEKNKYSKLSKLTFKINKYNYSTRKKNSRKKKYLSLKNLLLLMLIFNFIL